MRPLLPLALLSLPLLALSAPYARAGSEHAPHIFRGAVFHVPHFAFRRFAPFGSFGTFGAAPFLAPAFWDWDDAADIAALAGSAPGPVIVLNLAPPAAPPAPAAAALTTVETTHGVTVIRGPGTRHFAP
jgi:hypothetical protein